MDTIGKSSTDVIREIAHYMKSSTEQEKEIFTPRMNDAWFDLVKLCVSIGFIVLHLVKANLVLPNIGPHRHARRGRR